MIEKLNTILSDDASAKEIRMTIVSFIRDFDASPSEIDFKRYIEWMRDLYHDNDYILISLDEWYDDIRSMYYHGVYIIQQL